MRTHQHCCTGAPAVPATSSSCCPGQWFREQSRAETTSLCSTGASPRKTAPEPRPSCRWPGHAAACCRGTAQHSTHSRVLSRPAWRGGWLGRGAAAAACHQQAACYFCAHANWVGPCCTRQWLARRGRVAGTLLHASERRQHAEAACCLGCSALCSQRWSTTTDAGPCLRRIRTGGGRRSRLPHPLRGSAPDPAAASAGWWPLGLRGSSQPGWKLIHAADGTFPCSDRAEWESRLRGLTGAGAGADQSARRRWAVGGTPHCPPALPTPHLLPYVLL